MPTNQGQQDGAKYRDRDEALAQILLREKLLQPPTLDTDLLQFMIMAGFGCPGHTFADPAREETRRQVFFQYKERRFRLSCPAKLMETRAYGSLTAPYLDRRYNVDTVRDLSNVIDGSRLGLPFYNVGVMTMARTNQALEYFGLPPLRFTVRPLQAEYIRGRLEPYSPMLLRF